MEYSETQFYVLDHSDNQNDSAYFLECQNIVHVLSTLHQRFTYVHLLNTHLTGSCPAFSLTLTTIALNYSRLRWFEASSCKATPRDFPSSSVQLRTGAAYAAACARGTQTSAHLSLKFSSFGVSTQYLILSGRISA